MLSREYRKTKERIDSLDRLISQAFILSESLDAAKDALLLYKRGELQALKEKFYDKAADRFLRLNAADPSMRDVIHYLSVGLEQRMNVVEKATRQFLNDLTKERSTTMGAWPPMSAASRAYQAKQSSALGAWYNPVSWFEEDPVRAMGTDKYYGEKALQYYYDAASMYGDFKATFPAFQDLKNHYGATWDAIIDGVGLGWRLNVDRLSDSKVKDAMTSLANAGEGKLPANVSSFTQAVGQEAVDPTWVENVAFASLPVLTPLADVGEAVLNVGKTAAQAASGAASATAFISRYKILLYPALLIGAYVYFFGLKDPRKFLKGE